LTAQQGGDQDYLIYNFGQKLLPELVVPISLLGEEALVDLRDESRSDGT